MSEKTEVPADRATALVTVTHLVYALHALSLLIGLTTAATIVGAFVFGVPSIIAVVINYAKRGEARGTFLESHFRWADSDVLVCAPLVRDRHGAVRYFRGHPACGSGFLRGRCVGHLPDRSRVAGAARSKADVCEQLIADRTLILDY
jgi:hypothetical protein